MPAVLSLRRALRHLALLGGVGLLAPAAWAVPAAAAPAVVASTVPPAKQALIDRLLTLWHPEQVAMLMVQRPAADAVQHSRIALQGRVSAEKLESTMKGIAGDAKAYLDVATPIAQAAGQAAARSTAVPLLAEQFSEDELRALIAILEAPVRQKFEKLAPNIEGAVGAEVARQAGPAIQPPLDKMKQEVAGKLRAAAMTR
ncbi:DUF2059 domain-containing protein [Ideonella sp. B7]|uniref:DUF2059 domain-containing protein n=1 Tax=Ideonella benzenivorans TaxID=2831643 RepID=UPI001CEC8A75|nr:DUF2059 domain-containing protein [Ideonella benzenivorans]MCA6217352.1 DUF2059 domain-containing protein [Ideonella benzenivorans]